MRVSGRVCVSVLCACELVCERAHMRVSGRVCVNRGTGGWPPGLPLHSAFPLPRVPSPVAQSIAGSCSPDELPPHSGPALVRGSPPPFALLQGADRAARAEWTCPVAQWASRGRLFLLWSPRWPRAPCPVTAARYFWTQAARYPAHTHLLRTRAPCPHGHQDTRPG